MSVKFPLRPIYDRDMSAITPFPKGVIVFDRDDTLVEDAGQHNDETRLKLCPGAIEAVALVKAMGFGVAIASNQAGLETEKFTLSDLTNFNESLKLKFRIGDSDGINLIIMCPHQESTDCSCRKPKSGLLEAIRQSGLGEPRLFIGDAESDRLAADSLNIEFLDVAKENILEQTKKWIRLNEFS